MCGKLPTPLSPPLSISSYMSCAGTCAISLEQAVTSAKITHIRYIIFLGLVITEIDCFAAIGWRTSSLLELEWCNFRR